MTDLLSFINIVFSNFSGLYFPYTKHTVFNMAHKNRMDSSHSPLDMNPYSPQAVRRVNHFSVSGSPSELCAHPFSYITYLLLRLQWLPRGPFRCIFN